MSIPLVLKGYSASRVNSCSEPFYLTLKKENLQTGRLTCVLIQIVQMRLIFTRLKMCIAVNRETQRQVE